MSDLHYRLQAATEGLLWPSETDAPVEVVAWERADAIAPETLLHVLNLPADTPVESLTVKQFFQRVTRDREWYDDVEKARVRQFQALADLLVEMLDEPRGFRVGVTEIDAFAIGTTSSGYWMGIRTKLVET